MQRILRLILVFVPALLIYFLLLPWTALQLDHRFNLIWRLPFWIEPAAMLLILVGILLSLRYCWIQVFPQKIESNLAGSPAQTTGFRSLKRSLGYALYGAWLSGVGISFLLRSPCLIGLYGIIIVTGIFFLRHDERPNFRTRFVKVLFGISYVPQWFIILLITSVTVIGGPALSFDTPPPASATDPGILVQIRCKPGTAFLWEANFNRHIRPAIEDVIARGNTYTGFQFIKASLPAQPFDFMLIYTGKTFAGLDKPSTPPQYVALFQREGTIRAMSVLKEMLSYEDQVTVTIVYLERKR